MVSEKVRLEQKIVPKNMVGRGEDAAENKKNFFISIAFFCGFHSDSVGVPQSAQALERRRLIPVGRTVGVTMDTEGLLGFGNRQRSRSG